jgi:exodeoxyribonuclease VII small subunit
MAKKLTLEESFDALDEMIGEMQSGELTLEESFQKYQEGMKLIKNCSDAIDKVEKKLAVINGNEVEDEAVRG